MVKAEKTTVFLHKLTTILKRAHLFALSHGESNGEEIWLTKQHFCLFLAYVELSSLFVTCNWEFYHSNRENTLTSSLCRVAILSFDHHYNEALINQSWQKHLSASKSSKETNWYIDNRQRWGSVKWRSRWYFGVIAVVLTVLGTVQVIDRDTRILISGVLIFCIGCGVHTVYCWRSLPSLHDNAYIRSLLFSSSSLWILFYRITQAFLMFWASFSFRMHKDFEKDWEQLHECSECL